MYTENGLVVDLDEVRKVIDNADVFTIGFPLFSERLLIDSRSLGADGPLIRIVGPVSSVQERFFELGRLRPQFGAPQRFTFFVWPHSVRLLEDSGLFERIESRCASGGGTVATMCAEAVEALRGFEHEALAGAIRGGEHHKTLWQASATPSGD